MVHQYLLSGIAIMIAEGHPIVKQLAGRMAESEKR
jgi:hypothetical protein